MLGLGKLSSKIHLLFSQASSLFSQTIPLFLHYSQTRFKFNPKTTAFGKVNSLHMDMQCRVQKSLCTVTNRQCIILKLFILVPIVLKLFNWYLLFSNYSGNNLPRPTWCLVLITRGGRLKSSFSHRNSPYPPKWLMDMGSMHT